MMQQGLRHPLSTVERRDNVSCDRSRYQIYPGKRLASRGGDGQEQQQRQHGALANFSRLREDAPEADQRYRDRASLHDHALLGNVPLYADKLRIDWDSKAETTAATRAAQISASRIPQTMETAKFDSESREQYTQVPPYELLCAAEQGFVGLDHRFLSRAWWTSPEKFDFRTWSDLGWKREGRTAGKPDADLIEILRHLRTPQAIPFFLEDIRRNGLGRAHCR
jgi:hypothetical protein